jgi:hypothetical protein
MLCNVVYALLTAGLSVEARTEFDQRLYALPEDGKVLESIVAAPDDGPAIAEG